MIDGTSSRDTNGGNDYATRSSVDRGHAMMTRPTLFNVALLASVVLMSACTERSSQTDMDTDTQTGTGAIAITSQPTKSDTDLTARQVLERMAEAYAECESYRDEGIVKIVFISDDGERVTERPFSTAVIRSDRFRFQFEDRARIGRTTQYIVHADNTGVRTWWTIRPGVEVEDSLAMALAGATGVSGGSAHTIPALLLPDEISGRRLTDMIAPEFLADDEIDDRRCYRIQGTFGDSLPSTLWIDAETFLVRRIDEENVFDDFNTRGTTTYEVAECDIEIADDELAFNPPDM